jgi:hypothetical protein
LNWVNARLGIEIEPHGVAQTMIRLQVEVFEQAAVRQTPTQTLQEELVLAESELEDNVVEIRETEEQ